jgi:hypothetical protein
VATRPPISGGRTASEATHFNWKKKVPWSTAERDTTVEAARDKNNKLKQIVADLSLDKEMRADIQIERLLWNCRGEEPAGNWPI